MWKKEEKKVIHYLFLFSFLPFSLLIEQHNLEVELLGTKEEKGQWDEKRQYSCGHGDSSPLTG